MTPTRWLPMQGTHGWVEDDDPRCWWQPRAPFVQQLAAAHALDLYRPDDPWVWSTELNGWMFWLRWRWFRSSADKRAWRAGAKSLRWYLDGAVVNAVCHSHGGNVWAYAAGEEGVPFGNVVLVGTPLRADLATVGLYERAIANSRQVLFVTDADFDRMQILGRIGDGVIGPIAIPSTMHVLSIEGIDHSRLLYEPHRFRAYVATIGRFLADGAVAI